MQELLIQGLTQLGLDPHCAPALEQYAHMLVEKNKVMNLTAITDPVEVAQKHMLDCAAVLAAKPAHAKKGIDVGTGAGFPGMVLEICDKEIEMTLLDSLQKRVEWLGEVAAALDLEVERIHGRAEEFGRSPTYRGQYDFATARAVADLRVLCELCLPFLKVGGVFLAMKAQDCQDEVDRAARCISLLGGRILPAYTYTIPGTDLVRKVIRVEKISETPEKYPRRFAKIQKDPL